MNRDLFHSRLGAYLNTMVADLEIQGKGQYLRELFGKFEDEVFAERSPEKSSLLGALRKIAALTCGCMSQTDNDWHHDKCWKKIALDAIALDSKKDKE